MFKKVILILLTVLVSATLQAGYGDDRAEIENLMGIYLFAMDFKDAESYASVFTEDAELDWAGGVIEGRDAIRAFMENGTYNIEGDAGLEEWPATNRHFITNQVIEVNGNTAKATSAWFQANNIADRSTMTLGLFGHYEDELVKVDGKWLFSRRAIYNEGIRTRSKAGQANPATR